MGVQEAIARAREAMAEATQAAFWAMSDAESRESVAEAHALVAMAQALYLKSVGNLDARPDAVAGARPGRVAATFIRDRLHGAHAAADVAAAHAVETQLPQLGQALASGAASRDHVEVAVRTLRRIPRHLTQEPAQLAKVDTWFTSSSRGLAPPDVDRVAKRLLAVLAPDAADRLDPQAVARREVFLAKDSTGMLVLRGQLDPLTAAPLLAVLDHLSKPTPQQDEDGLPIRDERTKGQRAADALGLTARLALGSLGTGSEVDRPRVVIHAPLHGPVAEADHLGPLPEPWLQRFVCDAVIETALIGRDGQILDLGRAQRTVSTHQRRALAARDGGCVVPGCAAPAPWCDGHHVRWWSKGGTTDLHNLALVCHRHHADIHSGVWSLEIRDGVPWARPPTWIDAHQRWIRSNTYRHHRDQAHQLALDLGPPADPTDDMAA